MLLFQRCVDRASCSRRIQPFFGSIQIRLSSRPVHLEGTRLENVAVELGNRVEMSCCQDFTEKAFERLRGGKRKTTGGMGENRSRYLIRLNRYSHDE